MDSDLSVIVATSIHQTDVLVQQTRKLIGISHEELHRLRENHHEIRRLTQQIDDFLKASDTNKYRSRGAK
jgi:hypothetical protein